MGRVCPSWTGAVAHSRRILKTGRINSQWAIFILVQVVCVCQLAIVNTDFYSLFLYFFFFSVLFTHFRGSRGGDFWYATLLTQLKGICKKSSCLQVFYFCYMASIKSRPPGLPWSISLLSFSPGGLNAPPKVALISVADFRSSLLLSSPYIAFHHGGSQEADFWHATLF